MRMIGSKIAVAAFAGWMITVLPVHAQQAPFAGLPGSWSGSGSIELSDGSRERPRCRATYQGRWFRNEASAVTAMRER